MNAPALIDPTFDLDALAAEINAAHSEAQAFSSQAVERAHDAGIRLTQAKAQCQHGDWLPWLAEHCPAVSERTARAYMQLARDWKALETQNGNAVADLSFRQAIKLLSAPKPANLTKKHPPKPVAKTATPGAYLPKPEPPRIVSKPGTFEAALVPVAKLDLSFPPPKQPLTPEQEYIAVSDAARRKRKGLPEPEPEQEPDPTLLGFVGIAAMQQLDGRFNDLWEVVFPAPEHVYFQQILRPVEEIRDYIPKDVRNIKQAQATVEFLEILTQQARLRLAWLEIHPEPVRPPSAAQPFDFGELRP